MSVEASGCSSDSSLCACWPLAPPPPHLHTHQGAGTGRSAIEDGASTGDGDGDGPAKREYEKTVDPAPSFDRDIELSPAEFPHLTVSDTTLSLWGKRIVSVGRLRTAFTWSCSVSPNSHLRAPSMLRQTAATVLLL
jgi:hypothetical protein